MLKKIYKSICCEIINSNTLLDAMQIKSITQP